MTEKMFRAIQATLQAKWNSKLSGILASARNVSSAGMARIRGASADTKESEIERAIREAYSTGYRQAYWDGVTDLLEAGVDVETSEVAGLEVHH